MFKGLLFEPVLAERKEVNDFRNHFPTRKGAVKSGEKCKYNIDTFVPYNYDLIWINN